MKKLIVGILAGALVLPVFAYDSLEALMQDQRLKQVEALKKYIAEHPEAKDAKSATALLTQTLLLADQFDEAVALMEKKYESLLKDKDTVEAMDLIRGCVAPMLTALFESGKKDKASVFITRIEKDWAGTKHAKQMLGVADHFKKQLNTPAIGDTLEIKVKGIDGKDIDLAALKGKVVLVDFWATWCGPCIQELPNVKAAYSKFKDKGFEIIGISLDDDKAKLEAFLKKDPDMSWPQACSGDGWDDALVKKYGVTGIPKMYLIGKDGKIAVDNPRGPGVLEKKLEELLAK